MAYRYPYGNTEQMNLDWFLKKFRELQAAWDQLQLEGVVEAAQEARQAANEAIEAAAEAVETAATISQSSSQIATNTQNIANLNDRVSNLDSADIEDNSDAGGPTVEDSLTALKSENDDLQNIVGNGSLSGFTATDLTGAANELKGSLNTKVLKATAAVQVPAQGANSGWVTLNGLTSNHELINWNFSTLGENQKLITIQCETDTDRFRISTLANYPPPNETCQPLFVTPL